jgi:hypothetical protein
MSGMLAITNPVPASGPGVAALLLLTLMLLVAGFVLLRSRALSRAHLRTLRVGR